MSPPWSASVQIKKRHTVILFFVPKKEPSVAIQTYEVLRISNLFVPILFEELPVHNPDKET